MLQGAELIVFRCAPHLDFRKWDLAPTWRLGGEIERKSVHSQLNSLLWMFPKSALETIVSMAAATLEMTRT